MSRRECPIRDQIYEMQAREPLRLIGDNLLIPNNEQKNQANTDLGPLKGFSLSLLDTVEDENPFDTGFTDWWPYYSSSPEFSMNHKLAERKRIDHISITLRHLNGLLPHPLGVKLRRLDILNSTVEYIQTLKQQHDRTQREMKKWRAEAESYRKEAVVRRKNSDALEEKDSPHRRENRKLRDESAAMDMKMKSNIEQIKSLKQQLNEALKDKNQLRSENEALKMDVKLYREHSQVLTQQLGEAQFPKKEFSVPSETSHASKRQRVESVGRKMGAQDMKTTSLTFRVSNVRLWIQSVILQVLSFPRRVSIMTQNSWNMTFKPPPEADKKRMEWTCSCGLRIAEYYIELKPGALERLHHRLNQFSTTLGVALVDDYSRLKNGSDSTGTSLALSTNHSSDSRSAATQTVTQPRPVVPDCEAGKASTDSLSNRAYQQEQDQGMYIILGHPSLQLATELKQRDTSNFTSDQQFFHCLKQQYLSFRGNIFQRLFSLRTLSAVRFVQFKLWKAGIAEVRKLDDIPPESYCRQKRPDEQDTDLYTYDPVPPETIPPLGSKAIVHIMLHCNQKADEAGTNMLELFPRKLFNELRPCPQKGAGIGWGLQFVDGISRVRMLAAGVIILITSTVFGVTWTSKRDDVQGGFTLATYIMMALVLLLGSLEAIFSK